MARDEVLTHGRLPSVSGSAHIVYTSRRDAIDFLSLGYWVTTQVHDRDTYLAC